MTDPTRTESASEAPRILIITPDTLGRRMGGPAIRAWEIARRLGRLAEVRLVSLKGAALEHAAFPVLTASTEELREHVAWADVLIGQGEAFALHPWIVESEIIIVVDAYDPLHLEVLESGKDEGEESRKFLVDYCVDMLTTQLRRADYIICASEKQRDFWLGHLGALGRISPESYDADHSLRALIDVVPFGVSDDEPVQTRQGIRSSVDGISSDDKVIIWGGGIYNWFDPLTLVRAVHRLSQRRPEVKLYFLGMKYPNSDVHESRMATDTLRLAEELGLVDSHVFFNMEWVDYDDRINYLLDADVAVSTHNQHIETDFSFRTRILDYLWAGLPIVATDGDGFAPIIRDHRLGAVVPQQDVDALAAALEEVMFGGDVLAIRENVRAFALEMTWDRSLGPLIDFVRKPVHAADYPESRDKSMGGHHRRHIESLEAKILELDRANNEMAQKISDLESRMKTRRNR
ncbi:glycosyltransferase family 4 protein [Microbacterium sp. ZW T6_19]|uniref:glycosyltransferase family 4 protein n=1 Tax=Microbacterium sp. ZW T6_19 TaxID=3378082 RepID=UPI0038532137